MKWWGMPAEAVAAGIVIALLSHDTVARLVFKMESAKATELGANLGVLYQGVHEEQAETVLREFLSHEHIAELLLEVDRDQAAEVGKTLGDLFRGVVKGMIPSVVKGMIPSKDAAFARRCGVHATYASHLASPAASILGASPRLRAFPPSRPLEGLRRDT
jgi:hypothetical protein